MMPKEFFFEFWWSGVTAREVLNWCNANLKKHQWKFCSKIAVMGAPTIISGHEPAFIHPRSRVSEAHRGVVFYDEQDALAFELKYGPKHRVFA